eukprot:1917630-Rhodomonas_salina.1
MSVSSRLRVAGRKAGSLGGSQYLVSSRSQYLMSRRLIAWLGQYKRQCIGLDCIAGRYERIRRTVRVGAQDITVGSAEAGSSEQGPTRLVAA